MLDIKPLGWWSRWSYRNASGVCTLLIQNTDLMSLARRYSTLCYWEHYFPHPKAISVALRSARFGDFFGLALSFVSSTESYVYGFDYRGKRFFWIFSRAGLRLLAGPGVEPEDVADVVNGFFDRMMKPITLAVKELQHQSHLAVTGG